VAFIEPERLAKLANDRVAGGHLAQRELAHFAHVGRERGARLPVNISQQLQVERKRLGAAEADEIELLLAEHASLDGLGVGALLGGGQLVEEPAPRGGAHLTDVLDRAQRTVGAGGELFGKRFARAAEIREIHLPLAHLVEVGGRDAAAGGAARLLAEHVDAVVFPREVEQAVREVGDERALVDHQARQNGVALLFERARLPPDLARVGDAAGTHAEILDGVFHDAGREQVELDAAGGVAGVGAAIDLEHGRDGARRVAKFFDDLGDETALAFVAEGDADIGDQLTGKRGE